MSTEHFDVLIVGAGLSGIGAAHHLQTRCPGKSYVILESRDAIGGTWDLFRYPGIRSDSDMFTLGYAFRPWTEARAIADGPSILRYVRETAKDGGIDRHIRFGRKVSAASWFTADARWTVKTEAGETYTCNFLYSCAGYYDYAAGYTPDFAGRDDFKGEIIHPQFWPASLDYSGKRVVVIGSGATAVTLVPEMAKTAAHVTMLQRSPTYVVSRPAQDAFANRLRKWLPAMLAYQIIRWRNVLLTAYVFNLARKKPRQVKAHLVGLVKQHLPGYDVETHFTPRYNPWDQRLCLVPDADLFKTIRDGSASVVTGQIDRFTTDGVKLQSGETVPADVIVTATGLALNALGGMALTVDGQAVQSPKTMAYKGLMFSGIPNFASVFGYTNASWTLKADLSSEWICRLLNHMDRIGSAIATPVLDDPTVTEERWLDFTSGYVQRALEHLPKQGSKKPWRLNQNYALDMMALRFNRLNDGVLRFSSPHRKTAA